MTGSPSPPAPRHAHRSLSPGGVQTASSRPNRSPCAAASPPLPPMAEEALGLEGAPAAPRPAGFAEGETQGFHPQPRQRLRLLREPGRGLQAGKGLCSRGGGRAWLTEQRIRRRAGGARGTQESHSPALARGAGAGGRRGRQRRRGGERGGGGGRRLPPHSPGQRRPSGCRRRGLAAGRGARSARLMSLRPGGGGGKLGAKPGGLRAAPRGSSWPPRGWAGGPRGGSAEAARERERP